MDNPFAGTWTYRSMNNDPDGSKAFNDLEFGAGTLVIEAVSSTTLGGTIGGGLNGGTWQLDLHGSFGFGSPMQVNLQGKGVVRGEEWVYAYLGWLVPVWPNSDSTLQTAAIVGSVVRVVPHSGSQPGPVHPAGVVASFYAVRVG
jgi:hypothetical protein